MNQLLITTSDWHLRTTVPCSRSEPDWYGVMEAKILALFELAGNTPILIAGDIFDRPDPPASLVSWAISTFHEAKCPIYCTVGQHDLKNHIINDRMSGAYGALVKSKVISDLPINTWYTVGDTVALYAMPWGTYSLPERPCPTGYSVAALHKYTWITDKTKYHGATGESNVLGISEYAQHFDAIAIGDNHIPWASGKFCNHGSLFGFASNQQDHVPFIGILTDDGKYAAQRFPDPTPALWQPNLGNTTSESVVSVVDYIQAADKSVIDFRESLKRLGEETLDVNQRAIYGEINEVLSR